MALPSKWCVDNISIQGDSVGRLRDAKLNVRRRVLRYFTFLSISKMQEKEELGEVVFVDFWVILCQFQRCGLGVASIIILLGYLSDALNT